MSSQQAVWLSLAGASSDTTTHRRNSYFEPLAREDAVVVRAEAPAQSTRSVHIALCEASPSRPRTSTHEPRPLKPRLFQRQVGCQVDAGGRHELSSGAESTVNTTAYEAALRGPQADDHPLGCCHLDPRGYVHRRERGHHLGGSSSAWRSTRRGVACSSTSSSGDESFGT